MRIGLETGPLTTWLWTELRKRRLPMVCLDARAAQRALDMRANKTDANDAEGLAHLVRAGRYKEVRVKSRDAMLSKAVSAARRQLLDISANLSNQVRGPMKTFGLAVPKGKGRIFEANVRRLLDQEHALAAVVLPLSLKLGAPSATVPPNSTGSCSRQAARRRELPTAHDRPRHRRRRRCRLERDEEKWKPVFRPHPALNSWNRSR